jgi:hypothetical protein
VRRVRAHWTFIVVAVAVAAAAGLLLLTACSSSGSGDSETAASDAEQAALEFAQCMCDNGVPSFPDRSPSPTAASVSSVRGAWHEARSTTRSRAASPRPGRPESTP